MKILLLADPASIHIRRWAMALSSRGLEIHIFGLNEYLQSDYDQTTIKIYSARIKPHGLLSKMRYLTVLPQLKKKISEIKPDLVHAHYASSYGLLGRLSGFKPFLISVWGSDVYDFPNISFVHKLILKMNLAAADRVLSTSHVMATQTQKFMRSAEIEVTPFGIDLSIFQRRRRSSEFGEVRIGTIKALSPKYGIDILIRAFAIVKNNESPLKLVIAGEGPEKVSLQNLVQTLGMIDSVEFLGKIRHEDVPALLNTFTIFCAVSVSDSESFGVSVVEACACEIPVVVSDAAGLAEVVKDGVSGFVVQKKDVTSAALALEKLIRNEQLREKMGKAGRRRVEQLYDWNKNVSQMMRIYHEVAARK